MDPKPSKDCSTTILVRTKLVRNQVRSGQTPNVVTVGEALVQIPEIMASSGAPVNVILTTNSTCPSANNSHSMTLGLV